MSIIDDFAQIVLKNPSATAKDIADNVGYSEPKSVYYWLHKAGFRGLKDFKHSVLCGRYPVVTKKGSDLFQDRSQKGIPVYGHEEHVLKGRMTDILQKALGEDAFGVLVERGNLSPLVNEGDVLLIDPQSRINQGDLLAVNVNGEIALARIYRASGKSKPVYVSQGPRGMLLTPEIVVGRISHILKVC